MTIVSYLHCIIDEPLERSKCTDHNDPWAKSTPQPLESKILHSRAEGGALHLVHVGHQGVSWVGDDRTEDAGNVSCSKCDHQLLRLAALVSWLRHHIGIDRLHSSLETGKLHHGVGNLTTPQGNEGLVETWTLQLFIQQMDLFEITIETLSAVKGGCSTPKSGGESAQL